MTDVRTFDGETWRDTGLDTLLDGGRRAGPAWVCVPTVAAIPEVATRLGLPEQVVREAGHRGPLARAGRPHVEHLSAGGVYVVAPTLSYATATRDVQTGLVTALVTRDLVVTAEEGDAGVLQATANKLRSPGPHPETGARQVLAALLATLVATAGEVEIGLGEAVAEAERFVFAQRPTDPLERIYGLKREIAEARRALVPLSSELLELDPETADGRSAETTAWLRRLVTMVDRVDGRLDAHDELLGDMLQVRLSQVSVRQNEDMRKISAWAAIAAVPTLVAGIYGMNFEHMPELTWTFGYPLVVGAMAVTCLVLYRVFKRSGWL